MRRRSKTANPVPPIEPFLLDPTVELDPLQPWFVYLFALSDCSAFKVGFSCSPLQRICTFTRRYFERFDLSQSIVLQVPRNEVARSLEAAVKAELASHRTQAPEWVAREAGGHTEWFSAVYFVDAETRLREAVADNSNAKAHNAFDYFREELERVRASFALWAVSEAQRACDAWACAQRGYLVREHSAALRDWLDAYSYLDLQLFAEDAQTLAFVRESARLTY